MNIGFTELLVIGVLGMLLFGSRLPKVGRSLGEGIRSFKKGLAANDDSVAPELRVGPRGENATPASGSQDTVTVSSVRVSMQSAPASLTGSSAHSGTGKSTTARRETVIDAEPENAPKKESLSNP